MTDREQIDFCGYEFYWSPYYNMAFYRCHIGAKTYVSGPFKTMADAAQAAKADYENARAVARATEVWQNA
jgi:hypothetical protein